MPRVRFAPLPAGYLHTGTDPGRTRSMEMLKKV